MAIDRLDIQLWFIKQQIQFYQGQIHTYRKRIKELETERKDLIDEWNEQEAIIKHNDGTFEQLTIEEVFKELEERNGDL